MRLAVATDPRWVAPSSPAGRLTLRAPRRMHPQPEEKLSSRTESAVPRHRASAGPPGQMTLSLRRLCGIAATGSALSGSRYAGVHGAVGRAWPGSSPGAQPARSDDLASAGIAARRIRVIGIPVCGRPWRRWACLAWQLTRGPAGQVTGHGGQAAAAGIRIAGIRIAVMSVGASTTRCRLHDWRQRVVLGSRATALRPGRSLRRVTSRVAMTSPSHGRLPASRTMLVRERVQVSSPTRQRR